MAAGFQRQQRFRDAYHRRRGDWIDSVSRFRSTLGACSARDARVLDLGCGHLGLHGDDTDCVDGATVVGVEPDLAALRVNRVVSHRVRAAGEALPFRDGSFDLVASAWVLEHLDNPGLVFSEVARVLRPRGRFVFLTPNSWNYNAWLIRAVPNRLHQTFTRRLYGRGEGDTYPVRYRANSARTLRRLTAAAGFTSMHLDYNPDPSYIAFNQALFEVAVALERLMDTPALQRCRVHIIGTAVR
jgi:SAM-dependent methyltransferase